MTLINILEKEVFNRISAGEVVESPRSIVKELVENAIDAGANFITIEIEEGGIRNILITDNGTGMPQSEVRKAFLPHATSKIKTAIDMDTIGTLGFRGEALPSIAAISKVTLKTKFHTEENGTILKLKGGDEEEFGVCAFSKGTSVEVNSLFFNTPARYKFLKSARSEESAVLAMVQGLILANANIAIRFSADGELKLASEGNGLKSAIKAVYPSQMDDLLEVSATEDGYRINGYLSKPNITKGNRGGQIVIMNGRVVHEQTISATIQNAYGGRLMTRTFPIFVFDIIIPFDSIDVNVHPTKAEVRLREGRKLYGILYRATLKALEDNDKNIANSILSFLNTKPNFDTSPHLNKSVGSDAISGEHSKDLPIIEQKNHSIDEDYYDILPKSEYLPRIATDKSDIDEALSNIFHFGATGAPSFNSSSKIPEFSLETFEDYKNTESIVETNVVETTNKQAFMHDKTADLNKFHVVGQMFQCYLLVESNQNGYIIDQHAAHERILYDKLVGALDYEIPESQPLLLPYVFEGTVDECDFLLKNKSSFEKIGFEIDDFGTNSVKIATVPSVLVEMNFGQFLKDILSDLSAFRTLKTSDLLKDKLAQIACKSAIKAGDTLNLPQIKHFIDAFVKSNVPLLCPHGRPTVISFDKTELEKRFKRKF